MGNPPNPQTHAELSESFINIYHKINYDFIEM